ncbi:MAG: hypothetical protein GY869_09840, partial [Planctomycetes bacterium]|nr:hypothetical protein [Planctomycetota bacterium]
MVQARILAFFLILIVIMCGCSTPESTVVVQPVQSAQEMLAARLLKLPTVEKVEQWALPSIIQDKSAKGLKITTRHYEVFTTMEDPL